MVGGCAWRQWRRWFDSWFMVAATVLGLACAGCGGVGESAPEVDVSRTACEQVDETVAGTLTAVDAGATERLAATFREMARVRGDAVDGLLTGIFGLVSEIWQAGLAHHPEVLNRLSSLLETFTPLLVAVVRYLASDGAVPSNSLELVSDLITDCPERSMTGAMGLLIERPGLIMAIGEAMADPLVGSAILSLPAEGGGAGGVDGFVALIRAVIRAINNPTFSFAELSALFAALGLDMPSVTRLLGELELLLTPENLVSVRALTVCLDGVVSVGSGPVVSGTDALGALLYGLLTDPSVRLGEQLAGLTSVATLLEDPVVADVLAGVVTRLANDDALRNGLEPGLRYLLQPRVAQPALSDLAQLLEAGFLPELLTVLGLIMGRCDVEAGEGARP